MTLGEYLGAGSSITKWLYRMNGNSNDASGNGYNLTATNISYVDSKFWFWASGNWTNNSLSTTNTLWIDWWTMTASIRIKMNAEISTWEIYFLYQANNISDVWQMIKYEYNGWTRRVWFTRNKAFVAANQSYYTITLWTSLYHNLIYVYDWTDVYWYVNWIKTTPVASTWNWAGTSVEWLFIWSAYSWIWKSNAIIDEVIVENRVRSQSEIQKYYTYTKGRFWI